MVCNLVFISDSNIQNKNEKGFKRVTKLKINDSIFVNIKSVEGDKKLNKQCLEISNVIKYSKTTVLEFYGNYTKLQLFNNCYVRLAKQALK